MGSHLAPCRTHSKHLAMVDHKFYHLSGGKFDAGKSQVNALLTLRFYILFGEAWPMKNKSMIGLIKVLRREDHGVGVVILRVWYQGPRMTLISM